MKQKQLTILAVASGVACAALVGAFLMGVQGEADAARAEVLSRYGGEQVEVCVALRDVATGERVDASALGTRLWIADLLPDDPVLVPADVLGKTATSPILKGEVVSNRRFEASRMSIDVPAGKEAVSVGAKAVQAVGGAVAPGMLVDVYSSGNTTTTAIVENALVLDTSVGDSGSLVSSDAGWITLAVDSEHVQEVVSAASRSDLYFVLPGERDPDDAGSSDLEAGEGAASNRLERVVEGDDRDGESEGERR